MERFLLLIILPIFWGAPYLSNITKTRLDPTLMGLKAPENKVITGSSGTRSQNQRKMFNSCCLYRFLIFRFRYTNQTSCSSWDLQIGTLGFAKISLSGKVNDLQHYCHLQPTLFYDTLHKPHFRHDFKWNSILYELLVELLVAGSIFLTVFWLSQGQHWTTYKAASFPRC